jgi:hypothetical protein
MRYVVVREHNGIKTFHGTEPKNINQVQYQTSIDKASRFDSRTDAQAWVDHGNAVRQYADGIRQGIPGIYSILEIES